MMDRWIIYDMLKSKRITAEKLEKIKGMDAEEAKEGLIEYLINYLRTISDPRD